MSDAAMAHEAASSNQSTDGQTPPTAGALLTQMREAAGMHREALASILKVPEAKLAALESDHYDLFAEPVFMRALASSACRALHADPAPVLALLPSGTPAPLRVDHGLNATFKEPGRKAAGAGASLERPKSRLLSFAVVALLLGAVAIAFYPAGRDLVQARLDADTQAEGVASVAKAPAAVVPAQTPQSQPQAFADLAGESKEVPEAVQATAPLPTDVPAPAPVAPVAPVASAAPAAAVPDGAQSKPDSTVGDAALLIRATTGQSWVQVRGSDGQVVLERLLSPGQSAAVPGSPPWSVVVGKADATEVLVRGKTMDLAAVARENVARFEVK